ncbi:MAG: DUF2949 domain-containing protein [Elainellaceae cyanobacterium]
MNSKTIQHRLVRFLEDELAIPPTSVAIGLRYQEHPSLLPVVLWQYGLITIDQLDRIFDWLEMG